MRPSNGTLLYLQMPSADRGHSIPNWRPVYGPATSRRSYQFACRRRGGVRFDPSGRTADRLLPEFSLERLHLIFRGRLTLQRLLRISSAVPAFQAPKAADLPTEGAPKAPELHTKAKGHSRAHTNEGRSSLSRAYT